jgi:phosphoenolpyruvate-protein kinase (PTS system EI component)
MLAHVLLEAATAKCREHSDTIARLTAKNERLKAALEAYEKHMGEMQRAAERHLTTDRRQDQFVNAMIYMLDGPEQRAVQALTRAALQEPRT